MGIITKITESSVSVHRRSTKLYTNPRAEGTERTEGPRCGGRGPPAQGRPSAVGGGVPTARGAVREGRRSRGADIPVISVWSWVGAMTGPPV
jgi:hypothetical protein